MNSYAQNLRETWGLKPDQKIINRVPVFNGNVADWYIHDWARACCKAGVCFHLDDDPHDVPEISAEEADTLVSITDQFTEAQREEYFRACVNWANKCAS